MKQINKAIAVCSLLAGSVAMAQEGVHWGYEGKASPEHWGQLAPEFALCGSGKNQSPIDISGGFQAELPKVPFGYQAGGNEILNNGHTVQVNYAAGSRIQVDGQPFQLKQFHFHAPSENLIDGKSYPLEVHLVHADAQGNLSVIGLMFEEGAANPLLTRLWQAMPEKAGEHHVLAQPVDVSALLPSDQAYYRFNGSLTTPPCSEGVRWLVLKQPMTASSEQIARFEAVMKHPNNRPVQPLNARVLAK